MGRLFVILFFAGIILLSFKGNDKVGEGLDITDLQARARTGDPAAMNMLGFLYYQGKGVSLNIDSAIHYIRLAADKGDITAAANLGFLLTEGQGVDHDSIEAIKWLTIASEAGVKEPQEILVGIKQNEWMGLSPDSALLLGLRYYTGRSPILGVALFRIAAHRGNARALALLGDAYSKGKGVPYDYLKSVDYFYRGAIAGNPSAIFILAELLEFFPDILENLRDAGSSSLPLNPDTLYKSASIWGINDAATAESLLLSYP